MFWNVKCSKQIPSYVIMGQYSYLAVNLGCILVPFLFSFHKKYPFYKKWKSFFYANFIIAILFIIWDIQFTKMGIWGFNPDYLIGFNISNLPIEEILFFICIPYACVFTYFALSNLFSFSLKIKTQKIISILFGIICLAIAIYFNNKWYTFSAFMLSSLILLYSYFKKTEMSFIYISYLLIIPFFLLSNGILTGMLTESPIVWYDGINNIEFRVITIPIEDFFYGFSLIALNILFFQYFDKRLTA